MKIYFHRSILAVQLLAITLHAQPQRVAIPAQTLRLPSIGASITLQGFCLDPNSPAPHGEIYSQMITKPENVEILVDNIPMTFEAATTGTTPLLNVIASGYEPINVQFKSNSNSPIDIRIRQTAAFGVSNSFGVSPELALEEITRRSTQGVLPFTFSEVITVQKSVDNLQKVRSGLEMLGRLPASPSVSRKEFEDAISIFQKEQGLVEDKRASSELIYKLNSATELVTSRLSKLHYRTIQQFQGSLSLPITGRLDAATEIELQKHELFAREVENILQSGQPAKEILTSHLKDGLITFYKGKERVLGVFKRNEQYELWQSGNFGTSVTDRSIDPKTIVRSLEEEHAWDCEDLSDDQTIHIPLTMANQEDFNESFFESVREEASRQHTPIRIVLERSPLLQSADFGFSDERPIDINAIALSLKERLNNAARVYVSNNPVISSENLRTLPKISHTSDVAYLHSSSIESCGLDEVLTPVFQQSGVQITEFGHDISSNSKIALVIGHADEKMHEMLHQNAGKFRNKIVMLEKCGAGPEYDATLSSHLIQSGGAKAVFYYNQEINSSAVRDVTRKFIRRLSGHIKSAEALEDIWNAAVREAYDNAVTALKPEILKLKNPTIQISENFKSEESHQEQNRG